MNHTTQNHWPGGKHLQKGKGNKSQKASGSSGKKKADKKGKGKEKAQTSANVLNIADIGELSITSSKSINFSCYKMSETVEWFLDSGCTNHITPRKVISSNTGNLDNYNLITSNSHSKLSEDLATFLFCSSLPDSYELTAWQYLDNITAIANYKLADIIARVLQEENR